MDATPMLAPSVVESVVESVVGSSTPVIVKFSGEILCSDSLSKKSLIGMP